GLTGLLLAGTLGCASAFGQTSSRIEGEFNFAYVPYRTDDIPRRNEGKLGIKLDYLLDIGRNTFFVGTNIEAFGPFGNPFYMGVGPNKFIGEAHLGYRIGNGIEFYVSHMSAHPFDGNYYGISRIDFREGGFFLYNANGDNINLLDDAGNKRQLFKIDTDNYDGQRYMLNEFDSRTEVGIRIRFSGKIK
ncbi:MAG: hypothetical protein AABY22_02015, partial [Nanoarchaeota archaeon]